MKFWQAGTNNSRVLVLHYAGINKTFPVEICGIQAAYGVLTMRRIVCFFALLLVCLTACNKPQSFEYRGIQNLQVDSIGLVNSKISLELVYFNPNNFGVDLRNVNCDIYINHNYVGKYMLDTLMHIAKRSEFTIPSSMTVDMKNIYKNALNTMLSKKVLVELNGSTKVGKGGIFITVPFKYSAMETFSLF